MLKRLAKLLLGDYALYRIYAHAPRAESEPAAPSGAPGRGPPAGRRGFGPGTHVAPLDDISELRDSPHSELRALASYAGDEALLFGLWCDGGLAGIAPYWWGRRYAERGFWPLAAGEAKLVQTTIAAPYRGQGFAALLMDASAASMHSLGFTRLYARVWHNHAASGRALERAGWHNMALVVEVHPFRRRTALRWTIPIRSALRFSAPRGSRDREAEDRVHRDSLPPAVDGTGCGRGSTPTPARTRAATTS